MRWITRENAKVDRVACPWLIRRFIDPSAEFLYVPADEVMVRAEEFWAVPYDVPGVQFGHRDGRCSFESLILHYGLEGDQGLVEMARIVHAADVAEDRQCSPEGPGLLAIAHGFSLLLGRDDHRKLELEFPLYDALYAWCRRKSGELEAA
jgi:hypothetical protein